MTAASLPLHEQGWINRRLNRYYLRVDGQMKLRSRLVMEAVLGRPLERHEHVHHINRNTADDRPENLEVIDGRQHNSFHSAERRQAWRDRYPNGWTESRPSCVECGTTERPHFGREMCRRCYSRTWARTDRERKAA